MKADAKNMIRYAGAVVAYLIGSGFASGQEVMQYFTAFGLIRGTLGGLITMAIMLVLTGLVMRDAMSLKLRDVNGIFEYYCGKTAGRMLRWMMPAFLYCIYVIMLSGAGALLKDFFGIPEIWGRTVMLVLSLLTVVTGIERIADIIGLIGPAIIVLTLLISAFTLFRYAAGLQGADAFAGSVVINQAAGVWWISAVNYGSFCGLILIPFLTGLAQNESGKKCAVTGSMLGAGVFSLTAMLLNAAMLSCLGYVWDKEIPTVCLADLLYRNGGLFFSIVMFFGIYTTAVPMLWSGVNKICQDEKTWKYRCVAMIMGAVAYVTARLPFARLINVVYPWMGYVGMGVFICIMIRQIHK